MKKLRIGIIGAGRIGRVHAQSIITGIPEAEIGAISDSYFPAAEKAATDFRIRTAHSDYRLILADPSIDAVLICSPTNTHADIAMEAAQAGKHIFCEKPLDTSVPKILEARKVIEKSDVKIQIGFNRRFDHNFERIKNLTRSGELGTVQIVRITSRDPEPPTAEYAKNSGGMFMDMTIHDFDMAAFQAGSPISEVYAMGAVMVDPDIGKAGDIDTAIITLRFENGAIGVIDNCRKAVYGYDQRIEVFGSKGAASAENDQETSVRLSTKDAVCMDKPLYFFLERYIKSFQNEIRAFVKAILEEKPVPVGIEDGLQPILVAIAAKRSMEQNRPISISEIKKEYEL